MAQANRTIGIARAAFYPDIAFRVGGGIEDSGLNLLSLANSFWAYGSSFSIPIFQGGYRRAQLQQSWSVYRETQDLYRSTVLNAFREVENNLAQTHWMGIAAERQDAAVGAARKTQDLTMELYKGALATSLELIYAQIHTLEASIDSVQIKTNRLKSSVALIRALGGGWNRDQLPEDDQIQPFGTLEYVDLDKPTPTAGIDVTTDPDDRNSQNNNLTVPVDPAANVATGKQPGAATNVDLDKPSPAEGITVDADSGDGNGENNSLAEPLVPAATYNPGTQSKNN